MVPQEIALYEDLSARENLTFWGKMYGLRGAMLAVGAALGHLIMGYDLTMYSVIGIVAGEFILATAGIGKRIAFAYDNFDRSR